MKMETRTCKACKKVYTAKSSMKLLGQTNFFCSRKCYRNHPKSSRSRPKWVLKKSQVILPYFLFLMMVGCTSFQKKPDWECATQEERSSCMVKYQSVCVNKKCMTKEKKNGETELQVWK